MFEVPKINIACYLSSAFACPDNERVFLSTSQLLLFDGIRNSVLADQPLPGRCVDQGHVDETAMLPAELLKSSIRNKRID